ncbi:hypothetical protein [Sneathiella aquimaris]|uniref:hypothetical protein n=1 Tax=Sneathiella aquimaris TaxID=2599305 RepID=UPI001469D045|nr:hypothetical protein [Sneathiella aquimaris]
MGALNLPQIAENQAAAYITSNDADSLLEKALCNAGAGLDAGGGDISVSEQVFRESWFHTITGAATGGFSVTLPAVARPFMMSNATGEDATLVTTGNSLVLPSGETRLFYTDGSQLYLPSDTTGLAGGAIAFASALVSLSADVSVPTATNTILNWDIENHDLDGLHDPVVDTSRFTVPVGISRVILSAQVRWDTNTSGTREIKFYKNGSSAYAGRVFLRRNAYSELLLNVVSPPLNVTNGDYFEVAVWQNSGGTRQIQQHDSTWFSIQAYA